MQVEIPSRKMPDSEKLTPVYLMQWATPRSLERISREHGGAFLTAERLQGIVNAAKADGYAAGEAQGRANLRADIESGEVPPIKPPERAPEVVPWCPVCKSYHTDPGEKTDAGALIRRCSVIDRDDPRNHV